MWHSSNFTQEISTNKYCEFCQLSVDAFLFFFFSQRDYLHFFFKVGLSTIAGKTMNLSYIISTYDFLYLLSEILEELHKTHSH
jgi:hypothetical protein